MSFGCTDTNQELHVLSKARARKLAQDKASDANNIDEYRAQIILGQAPKIPSPSIFNFFHESEKGLAQAAKPPLPSIAELATHLELLDTFHALRQRVLLSGEIDNAFEIQPKRLTKVGRRGEKKTLKDDTLWERRQIKWARFVEFAVVRFLVWKESLMSQQETDHVVLPPLDVLIVWHAFLLNPLLFLQYCKNDAFYWIKLSWTEVHSAIDNLESNYAQGGKAEATFQDSTGLSADLFQQFSGWAEHSQLVSDEKLTYLSKYSLDWKNENSVLGLEGPAPSEYSLTINKVLLESKLNKLTFSQQAIAEDMTRTAAKYAELFNKYNSGDGLALELRDAVIRQCEFVDKMNSLLWIRSPSLPGTLRRATARYEKFLALIRLHPGQFVVPTLDIDLAWHTHQCMAGFYAKEVTVRAGRFVNHDDKASKPSLDNGHSETKKLYKFHFVEEYDRCGCWECECLLEYVEQATSSGTGNINMTKIAENVEVDVSFHREMEVARRTRDFCHVNFDDEDGVYD